MNDTPKDLGETPIAPDMSNVKNPLQQTSGGTISIGNFSINQNGGNANTESIKDIVQKEQKDAGHAN